MANQTRKKWNHIFYKKDLTGNKSQKWLQQFIPKTVKTEEQENVKH